MARKDNTLSIGQLIPLLKNEFPDVKITVSKIRYWEGEGLISPMRAESSSYRRYTQADLERLRYIVRVQRDHYLPLKVIREHLEMLDKGLTPPTPDAQVVSVGDAGPGQQSGGTNAAKNTKVMRLTRRELLRVSDISEATLIAMERAKMIKPRRGSSYYGREALVLCVAARKLQRYGIDVRHLQYIKQAAEREVGLVEQAVAPHMAGNANSAQVVREVRELVMHAHSSIMFTMLEN